MSENTPQTTRASLIERMAEVIADNALEIRTLRSAINEATQTNRELERWKREQMQVSSQCDWQELGRALGLTLGQDINAELLPRVRAIISERDTLKRERDHAEEKFSAVAYELTLVGNGPNIEPGEPLTNWVRRLRANAEQAQAISKDRDALVERINKLHADQAKEIKERQEYAERLQGFLNEIHQLEDEINDMGPLTAQAATVVGKLAHLFAAANPNRTPADDGSGMAEVVKAMSNIGFTQSGKTVTVLVENPAYDSPESKNVQMDFHPEAVQTVKPSMLEEAAKITEENGTATVCDTCGQIFHSGKATGVCPTCEIGF